MKQYSNDNIFTIIEVTKTYSPDEIAIMRYLLDNNGYEWIDITYSKLARELGRYISNVRKAVLKLNKKGIVMIHGKPMQSICLLDDWPDNILLSKYN